MSYLQSMCKKLISHLTAERIFTYPILGKFHTLLMIIICLGGQKRLMHSLDTHREVNRDLISGRMIHEALFNSRGSVRKNILERNRLEKNKVNLEGTRSVNVASELFSDNEIESALNSLKQHNFARIGSIHDLPLFEDLLQLCNAPVYPSNKFNKLQKTDSDREVLAQPNPKIDFMWNVQPELLWKNTAFRFILQDSFWMHLSDKFFSGYSKISGFSMWHSFPHEKESFTAENWHRDANDGLFFIKFFILLTDVSSLNGPTAFVPVPIEDLPIKFLSGRRYSDIEINKFCKKYGTQPIYATGQAGTIYVGDTRALHRGTPVISKNRSIINFRVTTDHQFGVNNSEKYDLVKANFNSPERFSIY